MKRSDNWKNIFDPSTGYVRPRRPNGEWIENTNPYHAPGFAKAALGNSPGTFLMM